VAPAAPPALSELETKYDKLIDLLVKQDREFTDIVRSYLYVRSGGDPMRQTALQEKLLSDARVYAATNRREARKLGMDIGVLTPPPGVSDVSAGMTQWVKELARAQGNPLIGALALSSDNILPMILIAAVLVIVGVVAVGYYRKNKKQPQQ
jgi:hypothetical protein